ncbi:MAG: L,D-transpeptidase [Pseudomonadota bacterium]
MFRIASVALFTLAIAQPAWADIELEDNMPVEQWSNYRKKKPTRYRASAAPRTSSRQNQLSQGNKKKWVGGPKPKISAAAPSTVRFRSGYGKGTIIIDTSRRRLFYVLSSAKAFSYPIAVGRAGFQWTGQKRITNVKSWPTWRPPAEMRKRQPKLPVVMSGGIYNPLGAKALYLGSTLYRIHGTANAKSIGTASSSGCFRMHNKHVVHLAQRAGIGTRVVVLRKLPKSIAASIRGKKSRKRS